MSTFHVIDVARKSIAGDSLFTVIMTDDEGNVLGGDHHWVRRHFAVRACHLYRQRPELHGRTESELREPYRLHFGGEMFDDRPMFEDFALEAE